MKNLDLLLVEDNPSYIAGCKAYFSGINNISLSIAEDYDSAIKGLSNKSYNGALIDCFFPRVKGSNDKTLGEFVIERLISEDKSAQKMDKYEEALKDYLDLNNPKLRRYARLLGSMSDKDNPEEYILYRAIKQIGLLDKNLSSFIIENNLNTIFKREYENFKDYFTALRTGLESDESNQALGILVAEMCYNKNIPFVLATSTHHHDEMTQPIQNYCSKRSWRLLDCSPDNPGEKSSKEFWKSAYEEILTLI